MVRPAWQLSASTTRARESLPGTPTLAPLSPVVVWHCRRALPLVERLRETGVEPRIRARTGLPLDPYYSAGKVRWLLDNVEPVAAAARRGALRIGTVDAWLIWRLTGGRNHLTDATNASRTLLYDIARGAWDDDMLGPIPRRRLEPSSSP